MHYLFFDFQKVNVDWKTHTRTNTYISYTCIYAMAQISPGNCTTNRTTCTVLKNVLHKTVHSAIFKCIDA
eukprot:m.997985 g.997985  ORF g.997985 m.997985 type:complete len:70 (+) comp24024_c0_seq5:511-720(+)